MERSTNALAELAERLTDVLAFAQDELFLEHKQTLDKAQRIVAELAKIEKPIDKSKVKPSIDGRIHFADILKADDERALEVIRNCRAIAEEGAGDGK